MSKWLVEAKAPGIGLNYQGQHDRILNSRFYRAMVALIDKECTHYPRNNLICLYNLHAPGRREFSKCYLEKKYL